jgi:hypothetical protein
MTLAGSCYRQVQLGRPASHLLEQGHLLTHVGTCSHV